MAVTSSLAFLFNILFSHVYLQHLYKSLIKRKKYLKERASEGAKVFPLLIRYMIRAGDQMTVIMRCFSSMQGLIKITLKDNILLKVLLRSWAISQKKSSKILSSFCDCFGPFRKPHCWSSHETAQMLESI